MNLTAARCSPGCLDRLGPFNYRFFDASVEAVNPTENFATCPVGFLLLLSMLLGSGGCNGTTAKQIERMMDINSLNRDWVIDFTTDLYHQLSNSLTSALTLIDNNTEPVIQILNGIVVTESISLSREFENRVRTVFGATVGDLIWPWSARQLMELWMTNKHEQVITQRFEIRSKEIEGSLLWMSMMTFNDNWAEHSTAVGNQSFVLSGSEIAIVPTINLKGYLVHAGRAEFGLSVFHVSMKNPRYSFIVILPDPNVKVTDVEALLREDYSFKDYFNNKKSAIYVELRLPKFKLEAAHDLTSVATNMGISNLFDYTRANLIGFRTNAKFYVDRIVQESYLNVDENGIGAVAPVSQSLTKQFADHLHTFHVNRPFVVVIYDSLLGIPIISARVMNPII